MIKREDLPTNERSGHARVALALGAAIALLVSLGPPIAASADAPRETLPATEAESTRVTVELTHAVSLPDAVHIAAESGELVAAFAFENGNVAGEYAPGSGITLDEFLYFFETDYGTSPRVTGIVVEREASEARRSAPPTLTSEGFEEFFPKPVEYGGSLAARGESLPDQSGSVEAPLAELGRAAVPSDWRPDSTNHGIFNHGGSAFLGQQFTWEGLGLYTLPSNIGLEFEINQDNASVAAPQNVRPFCFDNSYKQRHWAVNQNYSWIATDWFGNVTATDTWMGGYADYNDATDLCRTSSIAVGLRYPKDLSSSGGAFPLTTLDLIIIAPRGLASSNLFSGNVQAVSSQYCIETGNWMAYTDCMGVTPIQSVWGGSPAGTYNRSTLSSSRGWSIPSRCWNTYSVNSKADTVSSTSCFATD